MQIHLVFQEKTIEIDLFDNPTVRKWFDHYRLINQEKNYYQSYLRTLTGSSEVDPASAWQNILTSVDSIKSLGFRIPFEVPEEFDGQQITLNRLHRFFTYNVLWYHDSEMQVSPNPYDPEFVLPQDYDFQKWLDLIDVINVSVHNLEHAARPTITKSLLLEKYPLLSINLGTKRSTHTDLSPWLLFDDDDLAHNYKYFEYDLDLVLLDHSILGKCVLQSFCEEDDLNARDCTGRLGSFGGFMFDLNDYRRKIYTSDLFLQWVQKHNQDPKLLPLEFPIGHIRDLKSISNWLKHHSKTFCYVDFVD